MKIKSQKKKIRIKKESREIIKKKKKDKTKDRLVSIVDKDVRHGAKSDEKKFTGYKVNSIMSEDGFIKNINATPGLSLIHISEPTRLLSISYAVFCLKKKK